MSFADETLNHNNYLWKREASYFELTITVLDRI